MSTDKDAKAKDIFKQTLKDTIQEYLDNPDGYELAAFVYVKKDPEERPNYHGESGQVTISSAKFERTSELLKEKLSKLFDNIVISK